MNYKTKITFGVRQTYIKLLNNTFDNINAKTSTVMLAGINGDFMINLTTITVDNVMLSILLGQL